MPVDLKAPYAPASTVINAIRHFRDKGLPIVIDTNFLVRIGISASLKNWVFGTFKFLDLITDDGKPTESFEALRKASDHDYSGILAGLLKEAYRLVFEIVPMPAESTRRAIDTAFKDYQPHAQRARMMALFLGLCLEAKLIPEGFDSKSISSKPRASSPRRVQKTRSNEAASMAQKVTPVNQPQHKPETLQSRNSGDAKSIQLKGGAGLTLQLSVSLLQLDRSDRNFVLSLIESLETYAEGDSIKQSTTSEDQS